MHVGRVVAVVAADLTDVAALHLGVIDDTIINNDNAPASDGAIPALAVVGGVSSFASIASAELYATPSWIEVPGVLEQYDLPDLVASFALPTNQSSGRVRPVLLLGPTDAMRDCTISSYRFPARLIT